MVPFFAPSTPFTELDGRDVAILWGRKSFYCRSYYTLSDRYGNTTAFGSVEGQISSTTHELCRLRFNDDFWRWMWDAEEDS